MKKTQGFITVATGSEEYYRLACSLLHSYHYFSERPLPFAILTDQENSWTMQFDNVILMPDGATNTYLDKLSMGQVLPYDINIFIDADCLAFGDLNRLFEDFEEADDFSCFGRVLPLDDKTGWFEYKDLGKLQSRVSYVVGLHGGIYYMRKGQMCSKIFEDAKSFVPDYKKYHFKGRFSNPGDEPLIALSMAVNNCHPIPFKQDAICCYWEYVGNMQIDITSGTARIKGEDACNVRLLHWGTRYTRELEYKKQIELLKLIETYSDRRSLRVQINMCKIRYGWLKSIERLKHFAVRVKNKIKRTFGIK